MLLTAPDSLVRRHGRVVTLRRVTAAVYDEDGALDAAATATEDVEIRAILSQPSSGGDQEAEGRTSSGLRRATVESTTDVRADREGGADRVIVDGVAYRVQDVGDDVHPLIPGLRKKTLLLELDRGR